VKVSYDPKQTTLERVLIQFWENHDPTQGNRQGGDVGSNYRSAVFYRNEAERQLAEKTRDIYQTNLQAAGIKGAITTEIAALKNFTSAEDYHQDYLVKNPSGYCGLGGTGVTYRDAKQAAGSNTPLSQEATTASFEAGWKQVSLNDREQVIAFEAVECAYCKEFDREVLAHWQFPEPIVSTYLKAPPPGWQLNGSLIGTPTVVLFRDKAEVGRYVGYRGADDFRVWLGRQRSAGGST
jgi:peptide methionine sulfoxide reductase msrA/msrB